MTTLNISLPESMRTFIEEQVHKGGYSTASEYIRHLIREEQERTDHRRLEELLLEGLDSGDSIQVTDEWGEQKRVQLMERFRPKNK